MAVDGFDGVLSAAKAGQEWAVASLYGAVQPALLRYLEWQEPKMADDLASETWLAVAERIAAFAGSERQFKAWVFGIARRRLADHRRRAARRRTTPVANNLLESVPDSNDPADVVIDKMSGERAIGILTASLSRGQAEILMLRIVAGLSVEETANVISKRPGNVRVLQHLALRRLAKELNRPSAVEV